MASGTTKASLLRPSEGEALLNVVLREASSESLCRTAHRFMSLFPLHKDRFRACSALVLLLLRGGGCGGDGGNGRVEERRGRKIVELSACQRIACYYILSVVHCGAIQPQNSYLAYNPFYSLLSKLALGEGASMVPRLERMAIYEILCSGCSPEIQHSTPQALVKSAFGEGKGKRLQQKDESRKQRIQIGKHVPWEFIGRGADMNAIVAEKSEVSNQSGNIGVGVGIGNSHLTSSEVQPPFIRPSPPDLPVQASDFEWIHLSNGLELGASAASQATASGREANLEKLNELLSKALEGPLLPSHQQHLISEIHSEAAFNPEECGIITPSTLPILVENNPVVAVVILQRLLLSNQSTKYFSSLGKVTFHSMEVMSSLISGSDVPKEITNMYIADCISHCQSVALDKYLQNRLVRLLCVFFQKLVRTKHGQIRDMVIEIQTFCIEFSRIKEAAALFRMLKALEGST